MPIDLSAPLVLRAIQYERLDDGESDLQSADKESQPAKPSLLSRAKTVMSDNVNRARKVLPRDAVKGLAKALDPVRDMMQQFKEIKAAHDAKCDTSAYTEYLGAAQAKFAETPSPENHAGVYLAEAVLNDRRKEADAAQRGLYHNPLELAFIKLPDAREKIKKACALRIEVEKLELERVRASEQKRFGPKYDANDSPVVKDHAGKVADWEQRLTKLNTRDMLYEPVTEAQRFFAAAKLLLEGDESVSGRYIHKTDGEIYKLLSVDEVTDDGLVEFHHAYKLQSETGKYWSGTKADFEKVFQKRF